MADDAPLPVEAIRDLLGLVRGLYAARQREFAGKFALAELEAIGNQLKNALRLAKSSPGTVGYRSAWSQAEDACARIGRMVANLPTAMVVESAVIRVRKIRKIEPTERELKRAAAKVRS